MAWPASVGGLPSARRLGTWRRCRHPRRGRRRPRANATAAGLRLSRRGLTQGAHSASRAGLAADGRALLGRARRTAWPWDAAPS